MNASLVARPERPGCRVAYLFPGQGSKLMQAGRDLLAASPIARRVFEQAADALGWSLSDLFNNGPEEEITLTHRGQPARLTFSVALLRAVEEEVPQMPAACLGHSLGEYSALVAAGGVSFPDALRCVSQRAAFMSAACPAGSGGMSAVLALEREKIEEICTNVAGNEVLQVANINAPNQIVISGHLAALERAEPLLIEAGARAVIRLGVSGAFHTSLMQPAADRLAEMLSGIEFKATRCPVPSNVTGAPHGEAESVRRCLAEQVIRPVRWVDCMNWAIESGVDLFVELGPGGVLTGLARSIKRTAECFSLAGTDAVPRLGTRLAEVYQS